MSEAMTVRRRERVRVTGVVQGVGFRPHVYGLATSLGLDGWVLNDERGVVVEVEGDSAAVDAFADRLVADAPPLAVIESVERAAADAHLGSHGFEIVASTRRGVPDVAVTPDSATCDDCLRELYDRGDRRFRYPFVNCTNCGPRFTIVRAVPYDRPFTTMAGFDMCEACRAEYDDPSNRRFHAQPNACPECGPSLRLVRAGDRAPSGAGDDALLGAVTVLRSGGIVAVKGLGGYHLACLAGDERAVAALRARKQREEKPFALMVATADDAARLVELGAAERAALVDPARPIVIARARPGGGVAPSVAPRSPDLGVMLPYSPLHHLLLHDAGEPLVMTSGNVADEPIAYEDGDALDRLAGIADAWLLHDRPIATRTDDSVVRAVGGGRPLVVRRSRGFVPAALGLPVPAERPILAVGAELKSTFCAARGTRAWVSHHIGDLENWATLSSFRAGVEHFARLFDIGFAVVAHDLHPDYLSTREAMERADLDLVGVQHHHAHLAACLAEHGVTAPAVGAIYDGTGYGTDGTVWGGEVLVGDLAGFTRAASLTPVRMPGGERAIREPWRMACAWLVAAGLEAGVPRALAEDVAADRWEQVAALAAGGLSSPVTTSAGRLFDAVAALCGIRAEVAYEGQAAIELEALADRSERGAYELPLVREPGDDPSPRLTLDGRVLVDAVAADIERGAEPAVVSARFHAGVADGTASACAAVSSDAGLDTVVLSGGVWQNRLLLERTTTALERSGLRVLRPERLPPNDGGISFGQAAVAAARERAEVEAKR